MERKHFFAVTLEDYQNTHIDYGQQKSRITAAFSGSFASTP